MNINIERTRSDFPALWERGGGMTRTGFARIIAAPDGAAKRAAYVRSGGHLACQNHALIVVGVGDLVIDVDRRGSEVSVIMNRIVAIGGDVATVTRVALFDQGEWTPAAPEGMAARAVEAAIAKSNSYHCRSPYWIAR